MRHEVLLTAGAERDLREIYDHVAESDSQARADLVLDQLMATAERLAGFPERGRHPRELEALGTPGVSSGRLQALSSHLPHHGQAGLHLPDR